jgi:acyl carrier protein phosphodiesterase
MNYLAHAYLSFNNEEILVGNMISDYVKGKKQFDYSMQILSGIRLHRAIDTFTDNHTATKEAEKFLKPVVGLYAGAFIDVIYDHFLATDKNEFADETILLNFTQTTYSLLEPHQAVFPEKFKLMFPYMKQHNWLYNYQFNWGIEKSFGGLAKRAKYLEDSSKAFIVFEKEYKNFQHYYAMFFPELKNFVQRKLIELNGV